MEHSISEILAFHHDKDPETGECVYAPHLALTAIYEIGLECIGAAEELEPLNVWIEKTRNHGGTVEEYWRLYEIINNHDNLREGQRKAWAKACGVKL